MVTELPNFKDGSYKTAQCVCFYEPMPKKMIYLIAYWDSPPTGYGSNFRSLAKSKSKHELKIWWDMQNEKIPFNNALAKYRKMVAMI